MIIINYMLKALLKISPKSSVKDISSCQKETCWRVVGLMVPLVIIKEIIKFIFIYLIIGNSDLESSYFFTLILR